jgi:hypothetical protein
MIVFAVQGKHHDLHGRFFVEQQSVRRLTAKRARRFFDRTEGAHTAVTRVIVSNPKPLRMACSSSISATVMEPAAGIRFSP